MTATVIRLPRKCLGCTRQATGPLCHLCRLKEAVRELRAQHPRRLTDTRCNYVPPWGPFDQALEELEETIRELEAVL